MEIGLPKAPAKSLLKAAKAAEKVVGLQNFGSVTADSVVGVNQGNIDNRITNIFGKASDDPNQRESLLKKGIDVLKSRYKEFTVDRLNGLVPEHMQNLLVGKGFVKLVMAETDKNQRLQEKMDKDALKKLREQEEKIWEDGKRRRVLVIGEAGTGKTTALQTFCQRWANGGIWEEFKVVLYIPLRLVSTLPTTQLHSNRIIT